MLLPEGQPATLYNFEVRDVLNTALLTFTNAHVNPAENSQVIRAFVPTGSRSTHCLVSLNETTSVAFGTVVFCGLREPASHGGTPGVLVSVFYPEPIPPGFHVDVTLYQEGASTYGEPVLCTGADGC